MKKKVLITGASSGIGQAAARLFGANGYALTITGRRKDLLESLNQELSTMPCGPATLLHFDVRNPEDVQANLAGQLFDIAILNAGLARGLGPLHEGEISDWQEMLDTNVSGLAYTAKYVAAEMVKAQQGHLIFMGSTAAKMAYPNGAVYCASKMAVQGISDAMRLELLPHHVKVSAIHPGMVADTEFSTVRFHGDAERASTVYKGFSALTAADVAEVLYFMATCPPHVNLSDVVLTPAAQADSRMTYRQ